MSGVRLTLTAPPRQRIDLSALVPDRLTGMDLKEVAAMKLHVGNREERLDSLFEVAPLKGREGAIEIDRSCDRLDGIGRGMKSGRIVVRGDAGAWTAAELRGGTVDIEGNVGPYAGAAMRGGALRVAGDAGDFLAASIPGERKGMSGGVVTVGGNAGIRAGDRMRRGMVLIAGDAGACCASRMIAGTVAVAGGVGEFPGFGMKRGSLILFRLPATPGRFFHGIFNDDDTRVLMRERGGILPTFADNGSHDLSFLGLMGAYWRSLGGSFAELGASMRRARRFTGDAANGGKGEILVIES